MLRLRELRTTRALTQKELARACGITSKSIWAYENEIATPPLENLKIFADFFECSIDYLVGREDDFGAVIIEGKTTETLSQREKELLKKFNALPNEYKAQVEEYLGYIYERLAKTHKKNG